ncbi:hypothetical protein V5799_034145 [Amblyomma americanum]|uniref:Uncharacterized protein n=1 Tax=Amblyomma americanum TaxID=6943 RepID=A0AAQ4DLA7_AMBAM
MHRSRRYDCYSSFDDSSSISSGLSDTFAELSTNDNLTDSSLSSDPYGCLKRRPHHPGMAPSGASAACNKGMPDRSSSSRKSEHHCSASGSGAVVGSGSGMLPTTTSIRSRNANVKKTDSSMQTESSALLQQGSAASPHAQSSANWKKYVQQQEIQHQQSRTNSTESLKSKDSKRSGGQSSSKSAKSADSNRHDVIHSKGSKSRTGSSSSGSAESKLRSYSADTAMIGSDLALDKIRNSGGGMGTPTRSSGIEYASTAVVMTNRKLPGRPPNSAGSVPSACMVAGKRPSSTASSGSGRSGSSCQGKKDGSAELDQCRTSSLTRAGELPRGSSRSSLERKAKVSGGTQTGAGVNDMFVSAHSDSEYCSLGRSSGKHAKQYIQLADLEKPFLQATFGPTGSPALGTMRERIYGTRTLLNGSPPSYASNSDYVLLSGFQHGTTPLRDRPRLSVPSAKGSESDNYMALDHSSPYAWLRHSPTSGSASVASAPVGRTTFTGGIAEADSMESLSSTASSAHGQWSSVMLSGAAVPALSGRRRRPDDIVSGTATCPGRIGRSCTRSAPQSPPDDDDDECRRCPSPAPESPVARTPSCPPSPQGRQVYCALARPPSFYTPPHPPFSWAPQLWRRMRNSCGLACMQRL